MIVVDSDARGEYLSGSMTRYRFFPLTGSGAAFGASGSGGVRSRD
jgi:hypothetical protein